MAAKQIDISDSLTWDEGLPAPQWDLLTEWVESQIDEDDRFDAWTDIVKQWLEQVGVALDDGFRVHESAHDLLLSNAEDPLAGSYLRFAADCRAAIVRQLPGIATFASLGKHVAVMLPSTERYYDYIARFYPEGTHGGSAGVHVRTGYQHIAISATKTTDPHPILAHETMHAALAHLKLPLWLEEGLTQMFEHDMTGRALLMVTGEIASRHKKTWKKRGLNVFWSGDGFHSPGRIQELSYQLAEILMRLLIEEHRPRWFGLSTQKQKQFMEFLRFANEADSGAEAARTILGVTLTDIASMFLGPGDWEPMIGDEFDRESPGASGN
jgi:hypothetical protein